MKAAERTRMEQLINRVAERMGQLIADNAGELRAMGLETETMQVSIQLELLRALDEVEAQEAKRN